MESERAKKAFFFFFFVVVVVFFILEELFFLSLPQFVSAFETEAAKPTRIHNQRCSQDFGGQRNKELPQAHV